MPELNETFYLMSLAQVPEPDLMILLAFPLYGLFKDMVKCFRCSSASCVVHKLCANLHKCPIERKIAEISTLNVVFCNPQSFRLANMVLKHMLHLLKQHV